VGEVISVDLRVECKLLVFSNYGRTGRMEGGKLARHVQKVNNDWSGMEISGCRVESDTLLLICIRPVKVTCGFLCGVVHHK
jgi:hypothetical protein